MSLCRPLDCRNTADSEARAEKLKAFSVAFEPPQNSPAEICNASNQREAGAKKRVERRRTLDAWLKRLKPSTVDPARTSPAKCDATPISQSQLIANFENPYPSQSNGPYPPCRRDPAKSSPALGAAQCTAALRQCSVAGSDGLREKHAAASLESSRKPLRSSDASDALRESSFESTQQSPLSSNASDALPENSPSCDLGRESCSVGSACDSPAREMIRPGLDDRRCDAPPSPTCEEPIVATARVVTYRRLRRVMADGGSTPGHSVGDSPGNSPEVCNAFTTKKSAAAATIPSGSASGLPRRRIATIADFKVVSAPAPSASAERPRGTSTLASWLRQGNGSSKERTGGASCPSDAPRVDDEYEIQRLRKSKLKRKAEASIGEEKQADIEERQGLTQEGQGQAAFEAPQKASIGEEKQADIGDRQGLTQQQGQGQAGEQEQKDQRRVENDGRVHEGQQQQKQQQRQRRQVQACLDFGQKDLLHTTCRVCGFVFAKGLKADEAAHDAHHRLFCGNVMIQKDLLHTTCRVCGFVFAKGLKADEMAHEAHHKLFCGNVTFQVRRVRAGLASLLTYGTRAGCAGERRVPVGRLDQGPAALHVPGVRVRVRQGAQGTRRTSQALLWHCDRPGEKGAVGLSGTGSHETCALCVCGFVFAKGIKADEAAHEAHHRLFCGILAIPGWRNERVVHTVSESTRDARNACSTGAGAAETAAGRIVLITHTDCTAVQLAKVSYCAKEQKVRRWGIAGSEGSEGAQGVLHGE
ncbi:unnamed protein product [Closterium sp. Yama58-4]|nr:unnamed protein product [Closterium sp. Yama58-4]